MVQKLQDENKRLANNLEQKVDTPTQQSIYLPCKTKKIVTIKNGILALIDEEVKVMLTLQDNVEKQRITVKQLQKENDCKTSELERVILSIIFCSIYLKIYFL